MNSKTPVVLSLLFMLLGIFAVFYSLILEFDLFFLSLGIMLLIIPLSLIVNQLKQLSKSEIRTYAWYKAKYPNNVQENFITCFTCENNLIESRQLINKLFQYEHYCTECGKILFYTSTPFPTSE
ncbi:MAG: hypothetical protein AB7U44_01045 [Sulfuricurvum sp.]|uniref:hypothetical protein n=1 Tax=Sulfuricurvum sp. TaxID=2025608 RepID=UPI0026075CDD|nr:hypothetical protein [uncultured Sulfuricurvum sp.]